MTTADLTVSPVAVEMILDEEGLSQGDWPGGASGVTLGRGWDAGYHTVEELLADWGGRLPVEVIDRLRPCCGVKGEMARALIAKIAGDPKAKCIPGVQISEAMADEVFMTVDLPRWIQRAAGAFEGYDALPDEIQGTLVSLVFNRGTRMRSVDPKTDERREMRAIRTAIMRWAAQSKETRRDSFARLRVAVAAQLRSMKRLWEGKKLGGLLRRREAEARLVETAVLR